LRTTFVSTVAQLTLRRYGGDEFALVLPNPSRKKPTASQNAFTSSWRRIRSSRLCRQHWYFRLSREGERIERLISEADEHLYAEKAKRSRRLALHSNSAGAPPAPLCLSFLSG